MIGKTQAARQPSIDELLASIRQAIHERVAPDVPVAPAPSPRLVHTAPPARPDSDRTPEKRIVAAAGQDSFAGLLGGDVRLEEALARLNQTAWRAGSEVNAPEAGADADAAAAAPSAEAKLRPTIEEWTGGRVPPIRPAPFRPAPSPRRGESPFDPAPPGAHQRAARERKDDFGDEDRMKDARGAAARPSARSAPPSAGATPSELLSSQAASAANAAFKRLADAVVSRAAHSERTLDEITQDCLRPLLKAWLDDNLPGLVERLVREEIERIARPAR